MQKNMSSLLLRCFLLVACLSLITGNAHALTVNCPASPAGLISIVGVLLHSPAVPAVQSITPKSSVSGDTMLCTYTVQVTQNYSTPTFLPSCPSYPLVLALTTAATAPFSAATAWAFGAPGTPMGSSYAISASQQINAAYSRIPISSPPLHGYIGNCKVVNNGVFTYAIYSNFSDGYTCSTTGTSAFTCTPPPPPSCAESIKGSQIPSNNWSASSSAPGYYAPDSAIINVGNGQVVDGSVSYATLKSTMGSAFDNDIFTIVSDGGGASNLPANVITCIYDGPRFAHGTQTYEATFSINCTNACGSL